MSKELHDSKGLYFVHIRSQYSAKWLYLQERLFCGVLKNSSEKLEFHHVRHIDIFFIIISRFSPVSLNNSFLWVFADLIMPVKWILSTPCSKSKMNFFFKISHFWGEIYIKYLVWENISTRHKDIFFPS